MKIKPAIFSTLTILFTLVALGEPNRQSWLQIALPQERQTSQIEAGYQTGCEITSILYALKFGSAQWRTAYKNIPGDTDLLKIRSLASKFGSIPSKFSKEQPAFSEKYGMNPNDVSWIIQMLAPSSVSLTLTDYFVRPNANSLEKNELLKKFQSDLSKRLSIGQPILMDLYFSNPVFSHAVLIVGVRNSIDAESALKIQVLDPETGEASDATVSVESLAVTGFNAIGISFYDRKVVDNKGIVISIHL